LSIGDEVSSGKWLKAVSKWIERNFPFKNDIRRIHAKMGGSVSTCFLFNRWIILQFTVFSSIVVVFLVFHIWVMVDRGDYSVLFMSSHNLLPNFMLYSSFGPSEKLNYSIMITLGAFLILINVFRKYVKEDALTKEVDLAEGENYTSSYAKDVFCTWDHHMLNKQEIEDFGGALGQLYKGKLLESKFEGIDKNLSDYDVAIIYVRRFVGFIFFLVLQGSSYAVIIYISINASKLQQIANDVNVNFLRTLAGSVPSLTVSFVNSVTPALYCR